MPAATPSGPPPPDASGYPLAVFFGGMGVAIGLVHWSHVGAPLPVTGEAKRFLWGVPVHGLSALPWLLERSVELALDWGRFWCAGVSEHALPGAWSAVLALALIGLRSAWIARDAGWALLWSWAAVVHGLYALELPVLEVAGRYQATHLLLVPVAVAAGWSHLEGLGGLPRLLGRGALALCIGHFLAGALAWSEGRTAQLDHLEAGHGEAGAWLEANNPDCAPIVLGEGGWIARKVRTEQCSPPLVDYYGLVDARGFEVARAGRGLQRW